MPMTLSVKKQKELQHIHAILEDTGVKKFCLLHRGTTGLKVAVKCCEFPEPKIDEDYDLGKLCIECATANQYYTFEEEEYNIEGLKYRQSYRTVPTYILSSCSPVLQKVIHKIRGNKDLVKSMYIYDKLYSDSVWHKIYLNIRRSSKVAFYSGTDNQDVFGKSLASFKPLGASYAVFLTYIPKYTESKVHRALDGYMIKQKDFLDKDMISSVSNKELNKAVLISLSNNIDDSFSVSQFCRQIGEYVVHSNYTYLEYGWLSSFNFKNRMIGRFGTNYSALLFPVWHLNDNDKNLKGIGILFFKNILSSKNLVNTRRFEIASENLDATLNLSRLLFTDTCEKTLQHILIEQQLDHERIKTGLASEIAQLLNCQSANILTIDELDGGLSLSKKEMAIFGQKQKAIANKLVNKYKKGGQWTGPKNVDS